MTLAERTDPAFRVGMLKWLADFTKAKYEQARDDLARSLPRGAKMPARSPLDDRKLGQASMSDPDFQMLITDEVALTEWYAQHYPDHVEHVPAVVGEPDEVHAVLARYAPHLVATKPRLRMWALDELRSVSASRRCVNGPGGEMDVPGVEVSRPQPRLTVTVTKEADEIMGELVARNLVTVDGQLREIEA